MDIYQGHSVLLDVRMIALKGLLFDLPPLDESLKKCFSRVNIPYLLAVTLSIISSYINTRLAVCICLSFTFRSGICHPILWIF